MKQTISTVYNSVFKIM